MTIRDDVEAFNAAFAQALAEQDAERLTTFYTDDARILIPAQPVVQGHAEIEATMRAWVQGGPVILRFETADVFADGSLVVDVGSIVGSASRSKYVVVHRRQPDGTLKIAVDSASSDGIE